MEQSSQSWVGMLRSYTCYFLLLQYLQHYTKEKGKYVMYMQFNIHPCLGYATYSEEPPKN